MGSTMGHPYRLGNIWNIVEQNIEQQLWGNDGKVVTCFYHHIGKMNGKINGLRLLG